MNLKSTISWEIFWSKKKSFEIVALLNLDATSLSICPFCASIVKNERKKNIWLQLPRVSKCTENGSLHERRVKP